MLLPRSGQVQVAEAGWRGCCSRRPQVGERIITRKYEGSEATYEGRKVFKGRKRDLLEPKKKKAITSLILISELV
jgi:hypothetical protein